MPIDEVPSAAATCRKPGVVGDHDIGCGQREDGVAQIRAGEIADTRNGANDLFGLSFFARPADDPDRMAPRNQRRALASPS